MKAIAQDEGSFREAARALLAQGVRPESVAWQDGPQLSLALDGPPPSASPPGASGVVRVPKAFAALLEKMVCHRDPTRWDLLYRVLYRLAHGERDLLQQPLDPDVRRLELMQKAIARDVRHVHAFVRFRLVGEAYLAWHRPEHRVLRLAAPFFATRFPGMKWSIVTPDESSHSDGNTLRYGEGAPRPEGEDAFEDLWRTYYSSIFNPSRLNLPLLAQKLPMHHRDTLPEARLIPLLARNAGRRVDRMLRPEAGAAAPFLPRDRSLASLAEAARGCTACPLCEPATQTVFGEGPGTAKLVLVGEQPGDQEDRGGRPFIGPAGDVLDDALKKAGIVRGEIYLTNAVKHFKFEPRGKLRLHQRPSARDVAACRPWVEAELLTLQPRAVVALGATAGQALLGPGFKLGPFRGKPQEGTLVPVIIPTWHPAAILRAGLAAQAQQMREELIADLRTALARSRAA